MYKRVFLVTGLVSFLCAAICTVLSLKAVVVLMVACLVLIACCFMMRRLPIMLVCVLPLATAAVLCLSFMIRSYCTVQPALLYCGREASVTMRVREVQSDGERLIVAVEDGNIRKGTKLCLFPGVLGDTPEIGDTVKGKIYVYASYEEDDLLLRQNDKAQAVWLYATPLNERVLVLQKDASSLPFIPRMIYGVRRFIHAQLFRYLPKETAAVCEGMLTGNRSGMSAEQTTQFRVSGIYHVLAVSGLHLSVISGAVLWLMRRLLASKRMSAIVTMGVVVAFMAVCGFTESIVRAGVMMLIVLAGMLIRRHSDGINSLGFAATVMLFADPFCVYSVGWLLSFAATLGLLTLFPLWEKNVTARVGGAVGRARRIVTPVVSAVGVSLCTSLLTCPIGALTFREVSIYFLPCNVIGIPIATAVLVLSMLGIAVGGWFVPFAKLLFWLADGLCDLLIWLTEKVSSWPYASIAMDHPMLRFWIVACVVVVLLGYAWCRFHGVARAAVCMLCALCVACSWNSIVTDNVVEFHTVSTERAVVIVKASDSVGAVFAGNRADLNHLEDILEKHHIDRLQWVLWIHDQTTVSRHMQELSVAIDTLILTKPSIEYRILPPSDHTTVLTTNEVIKISKQGELAYKDGAVVIKTGDTVSVITTDTVDAQALYRWQSNVDLLILTQPFAEELVPDFAQQTVILCTEYEVPTLKDSVPYSVESVSFACETGQQVWMTRQKGDITLRTY